MAPSHGHRNMRNGRHRNQGRGSGGRYNNNRNRYFILFRPDEMIFFRSNKHNGQSKSQPTLITQTRSLESSESSSKPTEDASEILKEITAKTEEISLTKWFKVRSGIYGRSVWVFISVQFMVETANSIQHRSSNLNTVTLLSCRYSYSLWGSSPRVRIQPL